MKIYEKTKHKDKYNVKERGATLIYSKKYRRDQTTLGMMANKIEHSQDPTIRL